MHLGSKLSQYSAVTIFLIFSVLLGGAILAFANGFSVRDQMRQQLGERATTIAAALDTQKVAQLNASASDAALSAYAELKTKLTVLKQSNSDARTIYIAKERAGEVFFAVDSEAPNTTYYSPPGQHYPEATPLFKQVFSTVNTVVEGPLSDSFGTWVSGLAPVIDFTTGKTIAVVGIDIDAASYTQAIWTNIAIPLLVAVVFIGILITYELARQRQQQLLRMRSELVSIASHELRTPITGMRWATESLVRNLPDGPQKTMATAMYDTVINLQTGTEDILQLTRLTKGRQEKPEPKPTDMTSLIHTICSTQALAAQQKGVKLFVDDSWPTPLTLTFDPAKMRRALDNVVSNAVKYTRDNTTITMHYSHDQGGHH
ncbi:MAG TPA: HAMP domain-containing sensor histidine kinase, partial [Candidatus Saccharimonadales bacterium]|nr:HAMP domain-containing sensor histidine kinase [Candidatus Saccharimonadales bacterium]